MKAKSQSSVFERQKLLVYLIIEKEALVLDCKTNIDSRLRRSGF
jgi:hypothetical protein